MEINKKLSRRERVYLQLAEMTQQITMNRIDHFDFKEYDATGIGKCLNITMNNTCMELNSLVKDGLVVKILGRPVYFFAREELAQVTGVRLPQCIWENYAQFREALNAPEIVQREEGFQTVETDAASKAALGTSFSRFVGADQSLKKCIDQARSAILYPPNGLHTLIIGETGTGKSYFAEAMYDFAVETGMVNKNTEFVIYNCASYSENPQLLLSQLFGYKKGAFTGADRECPGIIDQADGGVLFLDEAHRLSPEGQEKMFLLIDKGIFQRLGETQNYRKAAIRIIAATTEDPKNALLSTFLRRIAVVINIPPLEKRSFDERVRFVFRFLWDESRNIGKNFQVDLEVIKALVLYKCPGNIGQLRGDIRCLCASAYLEYYYQKKSEGISVELTHLPDSVERGLCDVNFSGNALFQRYEFFQQTYTVIDAEKGGYEELARLVKRAV